MTIIALVSDAYCNSKELAKSVARKMEYSYIAEGIIPAASKMYDIPEANLRHALKSGSSFLDRFTSKKQKYIPYLEATLANQMLNPNLVYHGFIGLPWLQKISHVMKVRIIANLEDRISVAIKSDKLQGKAEGQVRIFKEDKYLKRWGKSVYDIAITDSSLYDLVISLGNMGVYDAENAIETIISTAQNKKFQPMTYSLNCVKDIALSLGVKAAFIGTDPGIEIKSDRGTLYLYSHTFRKKSQEQVLDFKAKVMKWDGVQHVEIYGKKNIFDCKARGH